jgi:integrase/recombinase XerD
MARTERVRVAGPSAAFADGFGAELERLGYSRFTADAQLQLLAHVSGWLGDHGLGAQQLTGARVEEYLVFRRAGGHVHRLSPRALAPLLAYLRGLGVAPPPTPPRAHTAGARLRAEFEAYLVGVSRAGFRGDRVWWFPLFID